jgi:hypothetical protein
MPATRNAASTRIALHGVKRVLIMPLSSVSMG